MKTSAAKATQNQPGPGLGDALCVWLFEQENRLSPERHFSQFLKHIREQRFKGAWTKVHTPVGAKAALCDPPERLLITFRNNLIFSGLEDGTARVVTLSFTNNHLNLATKETQVLPKSQLMKE